MNNNPNNTPENKPLAGEEKVYSTLSAPPERRQKKRRRSLLKSQLRTLIVLGAAIVVLGVGVGLASYFISQGDIIVDTFTESKTDAENGKVNYTYQSRADGNGFVITDTNGEPLKSYLIDENGNPTTINDSKSTLVYETEIGSLLRLKSDGKITYYAVVDYNGEYVGGDTGFRVLIFPNTEQSQIANIKVHNHSGKDGADVDFDVVGVDTNGDGKTDKFQIKGYEKATINNLISAALSSYSGYTLTMKKLSIDFMENYDKEHADDESYEPLLDADKNIRFEEYGLDAESASYYELTTRAGKVYRIYIGSKSPNGDSYYIRYYDEEEGDRNAVYRLADDAGLSAAIGVTVNRTSLFLSQPETLVYAQVNTPSSMTTSLMAESFKTYFYDPSSSLADDEGYRKVIDFSYTDLDERNFTIEQTRPYILNDKSLLSGYMLNFTKINTALQNLYDISTILSSDYGTSAVKNYVSVKKLVPNVLSGAEPRPSAASFSSAENYRAAFARYAESVEKAINEAVKENDELWQLLDMYGLADPAYKLTYDSTDYSASNILLPTEFNCIWVSKLTSNNTYYIWAPMYQQIVEIGYQYFTMLNWDSFDWVTNEVTDISINYLDSIRVTGKDTNGQLQDILFEIDNSFTLTWSTGFVAAYSAPYSGVVTGSTFNVTAGIDYLGNKTLTLQSAVKYTVQAKNTETGELQEQTMTLNTELLNGIDLEVIKTYCRYITASDPNEFFASLSSEMQARLNQYASSSPKVAISPSAVQVRHTISDRDAIVDGGHLLPEKTYIITITYDRSSEDLTVTAGQSGQAAPLVYDEKAFENYILLNIKNNGEGDKDKLAAITEEDRSRVEDLYSSITGLSSSQDRLRITVFGADGKEISSKIYTAADGKDYIEAFRLFYQTILYSSYAGYADEAETVGGKKLTVEDMEAYQAMGDLCDLKIEMRLAFNDQKYVYRMYNYSATKSYITVETNETDGGKGMFYLLLTRVEKFVSDAVRASQGDTTIKGDGIY